MTGGDDSGEALQGAHVRHHCHAGLTHGEDRVGGCEADVAGGDQVDPGPEAVAVHGGDDRLWTGSGGGHGALELLDQPVEGLASRHPRSTFQTGADRNEFLDVGSGGEGSPFAGDHHHPDLGVRTDVLERLRKIVPERPVQGVEFVGTVEPHGGGGPIVLDGDEIGGETHRPRLGNGSAPCPHAAWCRLG